MFALQLNTHDKQGGAARAVYRIHGGLLRNGVMSRLLVQTKQRDDFTVIGPDPGFQKAFSMVRPKLEILSQLFAGASAKGFTTAVVPSRFLIDQIISMNPDLIHLHWICGGMVRIEQLQSFHKPMLWTLHDMWAFTGGCHYSEECFRYKDMCGYCPLLKKPSRNDLSHRTIKRKLRAWDHIDLTVVAPSRWMAKCAQSSRIFADRRIEVIPNGLDIGVFKPHSKSQARDIWCLPEDKKLILFGAISATSDDRKGFDIISKAMPLLNNKGMDNTELIVFGSSAPMNPPDFGFPVHYMGFVNDEISLSLLYSAADVTVVPSRYEAFGQTASESLACGTPVVAFDLSGLKDIVDHQVNGYLASPYDPEDLSSGIEWILQDTDRNKELSSAARVKAEKYFDINSVANQYSELYKAILF